MRYNRVISLGSVNLSRTVIGRGLERLIQTRFTGLQSVSNSSRPTSRSSGKNARQKEQNERSQQSASEASSEPGSADNLDAMNGSSNSRRTANQSTPPGHPDLLRSPSFHQPKQRSESSHADQGRGSKRPRSTLSNLKTLDHRSQLSIEEMNQAPNRAGGNRASVSQRRNSEWSAKENRTDANGPESIIRSQFPESIEASPFNNEPPRQQSGENPTPNALHSLPPFDEPLGHDLTDITIRITSDQMKTQDDDATRHQIIRVVAGRDMLSFVLLNKGEQILIGRDDSAELRLQDRAVSKRHAVVNCTHSGQMILIDLGSTNGTFVNGQQVQRSELQEGDHLEIGDVALRVGTISNAELRHLSKVVSRLESAHRDPLTGLLTRAFMEEDLSKLITQCEGTGSPISCAFVDLDNFKPINDTFGHQIGDEVLKNISRIVMMHVRGGDPCVRYGGDEMLIILPGIDEARAVRVIGRIRTAILEHDWARIIKGLTMTASFGVASHSPGETQDDWLNRADQAVYQAKAQGRNQVVSWSDTPAGKSAS